MMRKKKVVRRNPNRSMTNAYKMKMETPKRGLSQVLWGQKGMEEMSPFQLLRISARESMMRQRASPKGRKPGPGCLALPMER
jgi:hypothetical protein